MKATANSGSARSATVTVSGGGTSKKIIVTQNGKGRASVLDVLPEAYDFYTTGGTSSAINVYSNQTSWEVIIPTDAESWLSTSISSGSENGFFTLEANPNTDTHQRTASVIVKCNEISRTINVTQDGSVPGASLHVSPTISYFAPAGSKCTAIVSSNQSWTITNNSGGWLSTSMSSGSNSETFTMEASENNTSTSRSAIVSVKSGEMTRTICVIQGSNSSVGIIDIPDTQLHIFPNPATNELFINSDLQVEKVEIYSITGALLKIENNFNGKISVTDLANGFYFLKVYTEKGMSVSKFVKE